MKFGQGSSLLYSSTKGNTEKRRTFFWGEDGKTNKAKQIKT